MRQAGNAVHATAAPRVLLVSQPTSAGTARHVADLATGLTRKGLDVTVACPADGVLPRRLRGEGVSVIVLPMRRSIAPLADALSFVRLVRLCRRLRPDVLHLHSSKAGFLGRIAGHLSGVPVVAFTPHCWSFQSVQGRKRDFYLALERFASRFCDVTITVSEQEANEAREFGVVAPERLRVIPNGLPAEEFEQTASAVRDIPFVSVGRLDEQKGFAYLIDAMALLVRTEPGARLAIVGDGPYRGDLEARVSRLGLRDAVRFEGEQSDVRPFLARAGVFVLSSLWEGLPYTIIEAMAARVPVISTDVGGCRELVVDGETGLLVPPRDPAALAEAMRALWSDPLTRERFGSAGHSYASRYFRLEDCVERNARTYEELVAGSRRADAAQASHALLGTKATALLIFVALALVGALVGAQVSLGDRLVAGVEVGGAVVGGLTRNEAVARIDELDSQPVTVSVTATSAGVPLGGDALSLDAVAAVEEAYLVGRVGALPQRLSRRFSAARGGVSVPIRARETSVVAALIDDARGQIERPPIDAGFQLVGEELKITREREGSLVDTAEFLALLGEAATSADDAGRTVVVPVTRTSASVTMDDLADVFATAELWTQRGMTGVGGGARLEVSREQIASLLRYEDGTLRVSEELMAAIVTRADVASSPPRDARFSVANGRVSIIDGAPGTQVDASATARSLEAALEAGAERFQVAISEREPNITRGDLERMGITRELSSFTTRFRLGQDARDVNISLAAGAIRGTVLGIGETFSLNELTGPRNRGTGYKESLIFSNGKVVPGIGGGVCQVSSTVYQAALRAGLRITDRQNHSMAVTYVDPGLDATAFYPIVDLKFLNSTSGPILVWTEVKGDTLTVSIHGSGEKPDIRIETVLKKKIPNEETIVYDKTLAPGRRVVAAEGVPGYIVASYRLIREDGGTTRREPLAVDEYRPRDRVIRVGY